MMRVGGAPSPPLPCLEGRAQEGRTGAWRDAPSPHRRQRVAGGTPKGRSVNDLSLPETQKDDKP